MAAVILGFASTSLHALKPSEEHTCCRRSDIRAGQCARFELTAERCAEIQAAFRRAAGDLADQQRRNSEAKRRHTAIQQAIAKDDLVSYLALTRDDIHSPPQAKPAFAATYLLEAARVSSVSVARHLIAAGTDVNATDHRKKSALLLATENGHSAIVPMLLTAAADVNAADGDDKTALMYASEKGDVEIVQRLLTAGASVHRRSIWGHTALWWAKQGKHTRVVETLIKHGATNEP
jgi:ankyrin repeat protein